MTRRWALVLTAFVALPPALHAQALTKGAPVRVQVSDFGKDWHEGTVGVAPNGCTMVYLKQKALGQYTSVSLAGAGKLQEQRAGTWSDVPLKPLLAKEPKPCRDGQND